MMLLREMIPQIPTQSLTIKNNDDVVIGGLTVKNFITLITPHYECEDKDTFLDYFHLWNEFYLDGLVRTLEAFNTDYNPLDNYDKYSTITTTYGEVETDMTKGTHTTTTSVGSRDTTNKVAPYDSSSMNDKSQTTESAYTDMTTNNGYTDTDIVKSHIDTVVDRTHGNIGTTRTQDMLKDEIALRKESPIYNYLLNFVTSSFTFVKGVE